jgi:uncharacterized protein
MLVLAGLSLGFMGSFHCIGMCGPIALALPVKQNSLFNRFLAVLSYNSGRVITYSFLGFLSGIAGEGIRIAAAQNIISILSGVLILALLFIQQMSALRIKWAGYIKFIEYIKAKLRSILGLKKAHTLFFIGLLNGLLPCGMVYMGIIGSLVCENIWQGTIFMMAFGLGTLPIMAALTLLKYQMGNPFRNRINKITPVFTCIVALLLILRGLSLGIPYISPSKQDTEHNTVHHCCHK